jgi:hypothetical protein
VADAIVKDRQEATIELITTLSNDARMLAVPTAAAPPESEAGVQVPMTLLPREAVRTPALRTGNRPTVVSGRRCRLAGNTTIPLRLSVT